MKRNPGGPRFRPAEQDVDQFVSFCAFFVTLVQQQFRADELKRQHFVFHGLLSVLAVRTFG